MPRLDFVKSCNDGVVSCHEFANADSHNDEQSTHNDGKNPPPNPLRKGGGLKKANILVLREGD
ncbi:hypothetical protein [Helicobacter macacae]|uniref:hypothetical protein n=1 Tax=Helicobacter macacae TaxID=398626 RepID=UPI000552E01F|nr:hypothetical protein [Helicobacter macacae]